MKRITTIPLVWLTVFAFPARGLSEDQASMVQVVAQALSSITISTAGGAPSSGPSTVIATVRGIKSLVPTGAVYFGVSSRFSGMSHSSPSFELPSNGSVAWQLMPAAEDYSVVAVYTGDENFKPSVAVDLLPAPKRPGEPSNFTLFAPNDLVLQSEQETSSALALEPMNGFHGEVSVACDSDSITVDCSLDQTAIKLGKRTAEGEPAAQLVRITLASFPRKTKRAGLIFFLGLLSWRRTRRRRALLPLGLLSFLLLLVGCSWPVSRPIQRNIRYEVTVTAKSGSLVQSRHLSVYVIP